ncbi:MAG: DNA repair protein RadC [Bacteroidales bacterium]|nr:DNA repair protein RadC [Bacteroidales bacterium]
MFSKGAGAMSNAELLAILIGSGTKDENVLEVSNKLLKISGGKLSDIASMDPGQITSVNGIGKNKYAAIAAAFELGRRCALEEPGIEKNSITNAGMVYRIMIPHMKGLDHEECWVLLLNRANYVIHKEMIGLGGITSTTVDTKIIMKKALDKKACGIILVHNHPSSNPRPGKMDMEVTSSLKKASQTFDISLIDHVIVSDDSYYSFAEDRVIEI